MSAINNGPGYSTLNGGTVTPGAILGDHQHEGLGGYTIETWGAYVTQHQLIKELHPDVVILQLGTNDCTLTTFDAPTEIANYAALLDQILADCAGGSAVFGDCKVLVTTVPPQYTNAITANVQALNAGLVGLVQARPRTRLVISTPKWRRGIRPSFG